MVGVIIDYTNWRGERGERWIVPSQIRFDSSEWHVEPQWLLDAHDVEKSAMRTFALKDIHSWRPAPEFLRQGGITRLDRLTDGRVLCCICMEYKTRDELAPVEGEPGMKWDVCVLCQAAEGKV